MSLIKNEEMLEVAVEASLAASDIIMESAHEPQIAKFKKSGADLVTHTDLESERIIKTFIKKFKFLHSFSVLIFIAQIVCMIIVYFKVQ